MGFVLFFKDGLNCSLTVSCRPALSGGTAVLQHGDRHGDSVQRGDGENDVCGMYSGLQGSKVEVDPASFFFFFYRHGGAIKI